MWEHFLTHYFGFRLPSDQDLEHLPAVTAKKISTLAEAFNVLGFTLRSEGPMATAEQEAARAATTLLERRAIINFVCESSRGPPLSLPTAALFSYHTQNWQNWRQRSTRRFSFTAQLVNNRRYYTLWPSGETDPPWIIAVDDPLILLHLDQLRSIATMEATVEFLVTHGVAFRTPSLLHSDGRNYSPLRVKHRHTVGRVFTVTDYNEYEERVREYLIQNRRVARAACLRGGILRRIVDQLCPFYRTEIIDGPTQVAHSRTGPRVVFRRGESQYVDDDLTQAEIAFITGDYDGSSWWPTDSDWCGRSFGYGFWAPRAESWFRTRRAGYMTDASQQPMPKEKWRSTLKEFDRRVDKFLSPLRTQAASMVDFLMRQ